MGEVTGRLESWHFDRHYRVIWGYVYEDALGRFADGEFIHTSSIKNHKGKLTEGSLVKTTNSIYLLGKPLEA